MLSLTKRNVEESEPGQVLYHFGSTSCALETQFKNLINARDKLILDDLAVFLPVFSVFERAAEINEAKGNPSVKGMGAVIGMAIHTVRNRGYSDG